VADGVQTTERVTREVFLRAMAPSKAAASTAGALADLIEDVFFDKGSRIWRRGEAPEHIFFIVAGTVRLELEGAESWEFSERSVVGVIDAALERPRARTAICKTHVHALRLRHDDWFEFLEENFELMRGIVINALTGLRGIMSSLAPSGGFPGVPDPTAVPGASIDLETATKLNPVERIIVLRGVQAFKRTGIQVIASLAEYVEELRLRPGEQMEMRSSDRWLAIVVGGVVEIEGGHPVLNARFPPRSVVGGISMVGLDPPNTSSTYALRAVTASILFRLHIEDLFDVMEDHFELARAVLAHASEERERLLALKSAAAAETTIAPPPAGTLAKPGSIPSA
jgi:CRP-like cAMP-binding protein